MYQLIQGADFLPHILHDKTTLPTNQITLDSDIIQEIYQKEIANVRITNNVIRKGNGVPIYYNSKNVSEELLERGLGSSLVVNNGEIQLHQMEIQIQVIDHQFQFIKDQSFINRQEQGEGFLSFDNRYRFILNPKTNFVGYWIMGNKSLPTTKDIENAIYTYIQSSQKKIKFTKQASFIVVYFGLTPTYFFVSAGRIQQTVVHKQALKLWENFLNKNSFSSDLHISYNEVDQLEHQVNQLSKEFDLIKKMLQGDADLQQQSIQPNQQSLYHGLLRQSSQKLFTGRSHPDTRRMKDYLSVGQLSDNSFYQDAPLVYAAQH